MAPLYLERGLVEPAGELLGQLAGARAHDPDYWALVARVAEGRGDHGAAREAWAKALTLRPRELALRRRLGFAARRAGDYPGALLHLQAVVAARPDDYDALVHLAIAAEFTGQRGRASEALERAQRLAPARPEAVVYLAWLAQRQGRLHEALARAEQADRLAGGTSVWALDVLASVLVTLGRRSEAKVVLDRALALPLAEGDRRYLADRRVALDGQTPPSKGPATVKGESTPRPSLPRTSASDLPGQRAAP
jgi:tetratricopeptide (TPR) repeat protein